MARDCRNAKSECKPTGLTATGKRGCATVTQPVSVHSRPERGSVTGGISDVKLNSKNISVMEETSHSAAELNPSSHGLSVNKNWQ